MLTEIDAFVEAADRIVFVAMEREACRERRSRRTDYVPADSPQLGQS